MLLNSTIATNTVSSSDRTGSQLYAGNRHPSGGSGRATIQLSNTIISGDGSTPNLFADIDGTFVSQGHNLSSDAGGGFLTGPGDLTNTDPRLGPLQNNGGPTPTMALLSGSPAINAGGNTGAPDTDQRGFARIVGGTIDIGAFEVQPAGQDTHLRIQAPATVMAGMPFTITVNALDDFGQPATGYTGTVHFVASNGAMANYSFTADDMGTHAFSGLMLRQAGMLTVTGTDTANASITGGTTFTITPAAADHLLFLQPPSDAAAGQTISPAVVVAVVDQYGNVETGDNSDTVTLSLGVNPSGGALSGTLTVIVSGGLATFSDLAIDRAGDGYTLHATTVGLMDAESVGFSITA
jgi:hypothetical protein